MGPPGCMMVQRWILSLSPPDPQEWVSPQKYCSVRHSFEDAHGYMVAAALYRFGQAISSRRPAGRLHTAPDPGLLIGDTRMVWMTQGGAQERSECVDRVWCSRGRGARQRRTSSLSQRTSSALKRCRTRPRVARLWLPVGGAWCASPTDVFKGPVVRRTMR